MNNLEFLLKQAENVAKRDLLLELMEEARKEGDLVNHIKYLEKYDSLKSEHHELSKTNAVAA